MNTLLITGGSSGIGQATADWFAQRGWQVVELSRHGKGREGVEHVDCDVCSVESVATAVAKVMEIVDHIDVLISNAGFGISGPIEFCSEEDIRRQMDVNFMGAVHIVKAVLPIMRSQVRGRIIFTSSVAAIMSIPYQSFYSASKAAVNALAFALRNEVREFGIEVSVLMPGDVSTGFTAARSKSEEGNSVYTNSHSAVEAMEKDELSGLSPTMMARDMWHIATCCSPAPQYVGGGQYKVLCLLERLLPKRLVEWILWKLYH